ncbi:MAG: hypothetical protein O8C64_06980 [Candidatus Methanoperedens sp.]|nr:hypothetical protein [Candidatus Methanoperedens sp.]MCZ7404734.1 hypothetical protein [Candidatus Methanoperedens sp.]
MSSEIENEVLSEFKHIAKPFMELGLYDSTREFIRDVTAELIRHKIEIYQKQLKAFEQKYSVSFNAFSKKLEKGASLAEEDEWMEWEAAKNMLKAWKQAAKEIGISA